MRSENLPLQSPDEDFQSPNIFEVDVLTGVPAKSIGAESDIGLRSEKNDLPYIHTMGYRLKRMIDFAGALIGLVLLLPVFITIAIFIRLDSHGVAIFKQLRRGKDSKPFTFYKFRSMLEGNDDKIHRDYVTSLISNQNPKNLKGKNGSFKIENDPRVTRVGRILRKTSLDELPQLINVLKGDMSLVGPRPPLPYEVEVYTPRHKQRLKVLPGITGLWQVNGRTEKNFEEMIDLDLNYIDNWSLLVDLKILYRTISAVMGRKGAW